MKIATSALAAKQQAANGTLDLSAAAAPLALVLVAYPAIAVSLPSLSDQILLATSILLATVTFNKLAEIGRPTIWLLAFLAIYILRIPAGMNQSQGIVHTLTLFATAMAFLTFAIHGSEFIKYPGFVPIALLILVVDTIFIHSATDIPKNSASAQIVYVGAFFAIIYLQFSKSSHLRVVIAFYVYLLATALSFSVTPRGLVVGGTVFLAVSFAAARLESRHYWLLGLVTSLTIVLGAIWFFTTIRSSSLASRLGEFVKATSGYKADTGRNRLWTYVLHAASEDPIFGLGSGTLPREFLSTHLSSHNYYLQVYLQVGALGIVALSAFLLSVWTLIAYSKTPAGRFGSTVFIMLVIQNATEATMFQNNTAIAIPAWCSIGLALSIDRTKTLT